MDGRPTWTDCDEAGDYVVPNVLSPRDLVFRPDNMEETVPHTHSRPKKKSVPDLVMMTYIRALMSFKFAQIRPWTTELAALERLNIKSMLP